MRMKTISIAPLLIAAAACNRAQPENTSSNSLLTPSGNAPAANPPTPALNPPAPAPAQEKGTPATQSASLPEPNGSIDPRSAEAAGQVVQHYGALIEQSRWTDSWNLWSDPKAAKQFDRNWRNDSEVHMEIGKPFDMEGAAGSSYISVPVTFYGKSNGGESFRRAARVTLRRVNDVPGSTEAQRHWHIARIEWGDAP